MTTVSARPLTYIEGNCFVNAYTNKRNAYKTKSLRLIIGSVAFNNFWEYGGEQWGLQDFKQKYKAGPVPCFDAHAWLEDDEGKIYDKVFPLYNLSALIHTGKKTKAVNGTLWEGISKSDAEALGFTYKAADKDTQAFIFLELHPFLKATESRHFKK